ncbi:hypothetical protein F5X96DRAFT_518212 [Biscogniauxia mediterranea]|nr:hypothetical protein F5X96DRAFT_518212 [Biscogniauxia mediterranea]
MHPISLLPPRIRVLRCFDDVRLSRCFFQFPVLVQCLLSLIYSSRPRDFVVTYLSHLFFFYFSSFLFFFVLFQSFLQISHVIHINRMYANIKPLMARDGPLAPPACALLSRIEVTSSIAFLRDAAPFCNLEGLPFGIHISTKAHTPDSLGNRVEETLIFGKH